MILKIFKSNVLHLQIRIDDSGLEFGVEKRKIPPANRECKAMNDPHMTTFDQW